MEREQLKKTLTELHSELSDSHEQLDQETRELLQQLSNDIDRLCDPVEDDVEPSITANPERKEGLIDQLMHLTDEFEESHPQLANVIGRVATALSRIGI